MEESSGITASKPKSSVPDPPIRTLKVELLSCNSTKYVPCIPNSREPTPFETEFFKGIAMIVIRTKPIDEHFHNFFHGRKRLFEVQVQGKFKREPAGEIFVGAEGSTKLDFGILTRAISKAVLQFISTMVGDLHYSFGDSQDSPNYELPHVVSPIFPTFDKIIVTPPNETPPPLGVPFEEDLEYRKKRLKFRLIKDAQVDINCTYSFSVNTSNLDLLTWTIVGIPMVKPMDMSTYAGSGSVHLIGYEIPRTVGIKFPNTHPHKLLNYVFSMKLTPVDPNEQPLLDLPLMASEDELEAPEEDPVEVEAEMEAEAEGDDDIDDVDQVAEDAVSSDEEGAAKESGDDERERQKYPLLLGRKKSTDASSPARGGVSGWLRKKFTRKGKLDRSAHVDELPDGVEEWTAQDFELEATADLNHCPACVELNEHRREGRRRFYYILPLPPAMLAVAKSEDQAFRVRTYSEIAKKVRLLPMAKTSKNSRLSTNEKRRGQIVRTLMCNASANEPRLEKFLGPITDADHHFLGGITEVELEVQEQNRCWKGAVAVALSRRHWSEQFMVLTKEHLLLQRNRDSKRVTLRLPIAEILSVRAVPHEFCPLKLLGFLEVETFSRVFTLMVRSDMQINGWLEAFVKLDVPSVSLTQSSQPKRTHSHKKNEESVRELVFIAKPACWKTDKKRVYNLRRIAFRNKIFSADDCTNDVSVHTSPNALIEDTLRSAFVLSQSDLLVCDSDWLKFYDKIAELQSVCLAGLTECQRLAFFLNLYHVMVIHGCLIFGPPPAWNHWNAFFNNISYIVGFELISIAEVEYCILRAAMSKSSLFAAVAMAAPPHTPFPYFAATRKDFRLHFAINCGSYSLLPQVPIYTASLLDQQLDEVTRRTLEHNIEIDVAKKVVTIPRLPIQDYSVAKSDLIGNSKAPGAGGVDCLRTLASYLPRAQKLSLLSILSDPQHITVKHRNLSFKCRVLSKMDIQFPSCESQQAAQID